MVNEKQICGCPDITKYNFICDDIIDNDIPPPLPKSWFRMGIIGKSGCGKTNLLKNLCERGGKNKIYCKRFSNVFYVSPSVKTQSKKPKLDPDRFYDSIKELPTIIDRIQNEEGLEGRTLIIMDDISHELKQGNSQDIVKRVFQNNRHLGRPLEDEETGEVIEGGSVSLIIIAQRLNNLPRYIRSQLTHYCIFDPRHTKSELTTIYDELIHTSKDNFNEILDKTYKKPYNFMFLDTNKSKIYNGFNTEFIIENNNYL